MNKLYAIENINKINIYNACQNPKEFQKQTVNKQISNYN